MNNDFSSLVASANSILILLPTKPYFDQVAGALALYLSLANSKQVTVSCPAAMLVEFNRLIGVDKITSELGNKNLTIRFDRYPADNIERVSADVENSLFCLTVIPKPGLASPSKEQVSLNYSGAAADLIILIGGANETHFPALNQGSLGGQVVHLGTKELSVSGNRSIISFARPASSVSELIAFLLKENALPFNADTATNLLLGIEEGSNHFESNEVTAETFSLFADLLRAGGQRMSKKTLPKGPFPPGSIPGETPKITPVEEKPVSSAPKDWFEPKIYKGTSV